MLKHRGEVLHNTCMRYCQINGMSLTALAKKAGYNQSTIYRHFEKEDLPYHIIRRYGKAMGHDFRVEFPEMAEDFDLVNEPVAEYMATTTLGACLEQRDYWRNRYVDLLEQHNKLLLNQLSMGKEQSN